MYMFDNMMLDYEHSNDGVVRSCCRHAANAGLLAHFLSNTSSLSLCQVLSAAVIVTMFVH